MTKIQSYSIALDTFVEIINKIKKERERKTRVGEFVNVFILWNRISGISEPTHSKILAFILSSDSMHGQGNLFLKLFLRRIGVDVTTNEEWVVTAEKGRVDVMLKRHFPHPSVVIIENKSNWANDQPNQLYRYWAQNIHRCEEDCYPGFYENHTDYKIVYLIPTAGKIPSDNSTEKPIDYPINLPNRIPMEPVIMAFDKELLDWLDECIAHLPSENSPLINLLNQYKEYCKHL